MTSPQLGNYSNLSVVGEDALGVLYQGRDTTSGQTVTILVFEGMQPGGSAVAEQLKAAWAQLGALGHPGIALPLDHGEENGRLYLVEERVEGESLESLIARGAGLPVEQRVGIMIQAADALGFAHARGIVHQSLAPSRIHLLPDGRVKTAGFLIGRLMLSSSNRPGIRWGGRIYLSPEQISGLQADSRSDVFALGLIFYELLTHTHPFHDANSAKVLDNILHRTTFPTIDQFADLPLGLWAIIERCLAKRPEERYAGGAELAAACRQLHKDIADDRQLMLVELHTMLPRLSEAARRPEAPEVLGRLQREVQQLLASERVAEYVPLNRMISALSAHYRTIHSIFEEPPTPAEGYGIEAPAMDDAADAAAQDSFEVAEAVLSSCIIAAGAAESAEPAHEPAGPAESAIPPLPGLGREMDIPASRAPAAGTGSPENYGLPAEPGGSAAPASAGAGVFAGPQPAMSAAVPGPGEGSPDAFPPIHGLRDRLPEELFPWSAPSYPLEAPDARGDQPPVPGWSAQETSAARPADGQAELSPFVEAVRQDFPPPEAESPVETAGDTAASGFDWWSGTDEQPETTVPPLPAETASGRGWRQVRRMARRHGLKVVLAAAGLVVVAGAVALLASVRSQRGLFVILADARQFLASRIFGEGEPRITKILAGAPSSGFVLPVPGGEADGPALEVLVEQGRILRELGRYEESGVFLQRAIEIDPDHEPAQAENQALQAAVAEQRGQSLDDEKLRRAVADVTALIAAGSLAPAMTALNRMERDWPGQSRIARLKDRWEQRNLELIREQNRAQAEQAVTARRQEALLQRARLIEELFRQGRYDQAKALLDELPQEGPQVQRFQQQAAAAIHSLSLYEGAMGASRYEEALSALASLEAANPADPNLAELRRRAESRKAAARAVLTVQRLGESGNILLDGKPIGANGEVQGESVPAGVHQLTLQTERGGQVSRNYEFLDGQNITFVYDAETMALRPMIESDRALLVERKVKEEVHRYVVEHNHGLLRGSCSGELLVSFFDVSYKPISGSHGFTIPFRSLKLRTEERTIRLMLVVENKELAQFKAADAQTAAAIAAVWEKLKTMAK